MRAMFRILYLLFNLLFAVVSAAALAFAEPFKQSPRFFLRNPIWNFKRFGSDLDFLKFLKSQGYDGVDIEIADQNGTFYCYSPTLVKAS